LEGLEHDVVQSRRPGGARQGCNKKISCEKEQAKGSCTPKEIEIHPRARSAASPEGAAGKIADTAEPRPCRNADASAAFAHPTIASPALRRPAPHAARLRPAALYRICIEDPPLDAVQPPEIENLRYGLNAVARYLR
jgi:hypothetical protein